MNPRVDAPQGRHPPLLWALLLSHMGLLGYIAWGNSPSCDEVAHLTAGLYIWETGGFELYPVNPPLVKLVAAIPAALASPLTDWSAVSTVQSIRPEFAIGQQFIRDNGPDSYWYHTAGRLLCVPFTVLGAYVCFCWARDLYGSRAGLVAALCWCISPTVLGWGSMFTPDAAAGSLGALALYHFWKWCESPAWKSALIAGVTLGLAELTKTTWVILFVIYPVLWMSVFWQSRSCGAFRVQFRQLLLILAVAVCVLNLGYGFDGSGHRLGEFQFVSQTLSGQKRTGVPGNRFAESFLSGVPVPLPRDYVRGIDLQKVDFERGMSSYLCGKWSERGWWYYYFVAVPLKEPLGMLGLSVIGVMGFGWRACRGESRLGEWILLMPALAVFVFISSQTGFSRYMRYLLPAYPAACVMIASLWQPTLAFTNARALRWGRSLLLMWGAASSASIYPHSVSYFNELAGGPLGGHRYLLDANIDWGQDLLRLKQWVETHPERRPLFVLHTGFVNPRDLGIDSQWPGKRTKELHTDFQPDPGWYAVSVTELFEEHGHYQYLVDYPRLDRIGYSMWVFRVPSIE
jgi:hypothetical protein